MSLELVDPVNVERPGFDAAVYRSEGWQPNAVGAARWHLVFGSILAIEFLVILAAISGATILYHYSTFGVIPSLVQYKYAGTLVAVYFTLLSLGFRHHNTLQTQQLHLLLWRGVGTVALAFALFVSTLFLAKISDQYSRGSFIFQIIAVSITVCTYRYVLYLWLRTAIANGVVEARRVVLIGSQDDHVNLINELKTGGVRTVCSLPLPSAPAVDFGDDRSLLANSNIRSAMEICRAELPDDILILARQKDLSYASRIAHRFSELPCNIHIAPIDDIKFLTRSQIAEFGLVKTLRSSKRPLSILDLSIKRIFDIVVAAAALLLLSPLLLTIALAIKIDSRGNILFRQPRHGYNNRVIRVFKFRSMVALGNDQEKFTSATENDSRITLVGRILRRTSIDELPQLLNVLLGEMSIVGPRPHATNHNKMFEDQLLPFARRHNVKPGITGWAQVNGCRGPADTVERMQQRLEYDLYYIDKWSLFFDLKIILMTFFSKKAYMNAF